MTALDDRDETRAVPPLTRAAGQGWPGLAAGVIGLGLLVVWAGGSAYRHSLLVLVVAYALVALGMYVPVAWARSLSLAYGAYGAIGAYGVAVVSTTLGWSPWLGWLAGVVVAVVVSVVLSSVTARLSGFHLAAATLLFVTAFQTWLDGNPALGSSNGMSGIPRATLFGWEPGLGGLVVLGLALVALVAFAIDRLGRSDWGVVVKASGETPVVVSSAGVRLSTVTTMVLAAGGAIAATGGAFFAAAVGGITPGTFSLNIVFLALFMPLLGGIGSPWGAVLGAVLAVLLTVHWTALAQGGGLLALSAAVLAVLLVAPGGLLGLLDAAQRRLRGGRSA